MGPFGSGAFGVSLDPQVIEEHAKASGGLQGILEMMTDELKDGETPMYDAQNGNMTPTVCMTPTLNGMMTPVSSYPMTPSGALFSPRLDGQFGVESPGYQSPSPAYANPTSPGYGVAGYQFTSPIYNNAQNNRQSPNYLPR